MRWDGWRHYASDNPYERLCLDIEESPTAIIIESNCRDLLQWWQKKLPLKNQPSNPLAQLLRSGMDEAPAKLAEARTLLLDPENRAAIDGALLGAKKRASVAEFHKFLSFVLTGGELDPDEEENLYGLGSNLGLERDEMQCLVDQELEKCRMKRAVRKPAANVNPVPAQPATVPTPPTQDAKTPFNAHSEFLRMLRLSVLDEVTDDQRDAFCNMGEAIGLSGGDAEDIIDEYLEERMLGTISAPPTPLAPTKPVITAPASPLFDTSPALHTEETKAFPNFTNPAGIPMLLVTSGTFLMGSDATDAADNERPLSKTNVSAFYISRWPITNAQFEQFDPAHQSKRALRTGDTHPVVYVTHAEATRFCAWLSAREKRKYRLPTEAEWEYAAREKTGRRFPWGNSLDSDTRANFADANKTLPWAERAINCGFAETSPVGSFPIGASPFGVEDMAGNVWEWCLDCLAPYPAKERTNPRGPLNSGRQLYRGGSWKSRITSLRTTARSSNSPAYSANDVGFRIVCECGK